MDKEIRYILGWHNMEMAQIVTNVGNNRKFTFSQVKCGWVRFARVVASIFHFFSLLISTMDSSCLPCIWYFPFAFCTCDVENTEISTGGTHSHSRHTMISVVVSQFFVFSPFHIVHTVLNTTWKPWNNFRFGFGFVFVCLFQLTTTTSHIRFNKRAWSFVCNTLAWTVHIFFCLNLTVTPVKTC